MKKLLSIAFFFFFISSFGQYEAEHWFFGTHAALDFVGGGAPVPETNSQINTEEGCSSISNPCGNLILYTDGITVWNANHQVMLNGTGLLGNDSSTQSGIIVPRPDDLNTYYIFTVDAGYSSPSDYGLNYSVVDMTLDGGLGGVVAGQKNLPLVRHAGEKVTAVANADNDAIWVITFAPPPTSATPPYNTSGYTFNTFYAFKVTAAGVQTTAVISSANVHVSGGVGYMKVSPDGSKLVIANMADNSAFILDFDNVTGQISNPHRLQLPAGYNEPYGVEFSPDSSKLYLSNRGSSSATSCLMQYDLNNNYNLTIISTLQNYRSALQLALDGKIYQTHTLDYGSGTNEMSVIENPNEAGTACNYNYIGVTLPSGMTCHQGLPPFIQSYFTQINSLNVTAMVTNTLEINSNTEIVSVDWDFGDGNSTTTYPDNPPDNTHTQTDHLYDNPGTYVITVVIHLALGCDLTLSKMIIIPYPIADQHVCKSPVTGEVSINLHDYDNDIIAMQSSLGPFDIHFYATRDDAIHDVNELTDPFVTTLTDVEIYYTVTDNSTNVKTMGKFHLLTDPNPDITPVSTLETCDDNNDGFAAFDLTEKESEILGTQSPTDFNVTYYPTQTDAESNTNEITEPTNYTNLVANNDSIWYTITNTQTGCYSIGSFDLIVHPMPEIIMEDEFLMCAGAQLQIDAPSGFNSYLWSTGETTESIIVNGAGEYTVTVTDQFGCENSHTVRVIDSDVAVIENVSISDFHVADNNSITVEVSGIGDYEYSIDGVNYQDSNSFEGLSPGTYTVYVSDKNGCGVTQKEVDLLGAPQFFTPNGDGFNDFWQIINVTKRPGTTVAIYDRYGKLMANIDSNGPGWDGNYNGKPALSTDYWYIVNVKEPDGKDRQVKGHFALKR